MCGIIVTNKHIDNIDTVNKYCKNRGPDVTNVTTVHNIQFIHNLLHVTGDLTMQPLVSACGNIACIFNGEIYNYKDLSPESKSDAECIIPCYKEFGDTFTQKLDGDFCLILFDFTKGTLHISSDTFATKPLYYHVSKDDIVISSYISCCKMINSRLTYTSIRPNECIIFTDTCIGKVIPHCTFDLNQHKLKYDDWIVAFEKAILKRYPADTPLVCLSSGMDSGAICACLNKYKLDFHARSIKRNEDIDVLNKRAEIHNIEFMEVSSSDKQRWKKHLLENCEACTWNWYNHRNRKAWNVNAFDMGSMLGTSVILDNIKKYDEKCKVMLTGIGADEVMARHNSYDRCNWGQIDVFTENLDDIFPWPNFFGGSQANYIRGQEYVGGCFSIETRYPFLDKELVQEFLWLDHTLKNSNDGCEMKPALVEYLKRNNYPYHMTKCGFNV